MLTAHTKNPLPLTIPVKYNNIYKDMCLYCTYQQKHKGCDKDSTFKAKFQESAGTGESRIKVAFKGISLLSRGAEHFFGN